MPFGSPFATMMASWLVANTTGALPLRPALVSLSMLAVSAEAKTSAGAPWLICCTSADDASKLNVALAFGYLWPKAVPTSLNESVSDAAAKTVMSPVTAAVGATVAVAADELPLPLSLPQAAAASPSMASRTTRRRDGRVMRAHLSHTMTTQE